MTETSPRLRRHQTPPKVSKFSSTSTNRADFVNFHPKRPQIVKPVQQLHFTQGGPINSTYRQDYMDFSHSGSTRRMRLAADDFWGSHSHHPVDNDALSTIYRTDYVDSAQHLPATARESCRMLDAEVLRRQRAHEQFQDVEAEY